MTKISACIIVKDEEKNIIKCLENIMPFCAEIIVVDTGSTDHTVDLVSELGIRVDHFPWNEDFSAARNYSLSLATGEFIFIIDADETVSKPDYKFFSNLKRRTAYIFNTKNYSDNPAHEGFTLNTGLPDELGKGWIPSKKCRLFPRDKRIQFFNPVHELAEKSIKACGYPLVDAGISINHYGRLDTVRLKEKHEKYYALGMKKIEQNPNNSRALTELAIQAGELGRWDEAIAHWNKLLGYEPENALALYNLGGIYFRLKRFNEALEAASKSVGYEPTRKEAVTNLRAIALRMSKGEPKSGISQMIEQAKEIGFQARIARIEKWIGEFPR